MRTLSWKKKRVPQGQDSGGTKTLRGSSGEGQRAEARSHGAAACFFPGGGSALAGRAAAVTGWAGLRGVESMLHSAAQARAAKLAPTSALQPGCRCVGPRCRWQRASPSLLLPPPPPSPPLLLPPLPPRALQPAPPAPPRTAAPPLPCAAPPPPVQPAGAAPAALGLGRPHPLVPALPAPPVALPAVAGRGGGAAAAAPTAGRATRRPPVGQAGSRARHVVFIVNTSCTLRSFSSDRPAGSSALQAPPARGPAPTARTA